MPGRRASRGAARGLGLRAGRACALVHDTVKVEHAQLLDLDVARLGVAPYRRADIRGLHLWAAAAAAHDTGQAGRASLGLCQQRQRRAVPNGANGLEELAARNLADMDGSVHAG